MSSFYIISEKELDTSSKADISLLNDEITKLKKHSDDEDKKLLDLEATRSIKDDLTINNKAIIGVQDINASNSVSSRGYINRELAKKLNISGGSLSGSLALDVATCPTPTQDTHVANKKYIDDSFKSLQTRDTYAFGFTSMSANSWVYANFPTQTSPDAFIPCDNLTEKSYFIFQNVNFDEDNSFPNPAPMEFRVQAFESDGKLKSWTFLSTNVRSYRIPGENFLFFGIKYLWRNFPSADYKDFKICRFSMRRTFTSTFGNESNMVVTLVT